MFSEEGETTERKKTETTAAVDSTVFKLCLYLYSLFGSLFVQT